MDNLHLDQHISQQFNTDLEELKTQLLEMGGVVEQQLSDAIAAIETADGDLAEKVLVIENEVDKREVALDEQAIAILARRQPAASDLRMVLMATKITRDLERIGDEAQKIAKMAIALNEEGESPVTYMMEDPRSISRVMNVMWALRSLERIGDHARNISEHIIFLVKGLDVRHISLKEMKRQVQENP
ncbi:MAG: PhoU domain-containing protein [Exilibacterium sp.]